jgi:hypothetical protein
VPNIAEKVTKAGGIALRHGQKPAQSLTAGDSSEFVYSTLCLSILLCVCRIYSDATYRDYVEMIPRQN